MSNKEVEIARRYVGKSDNATRAGHGFGLTFAQYKKLIGRKKCQLSGLTMTRKSGNIIFTDLTLDRLDNSKGYTKDNTIAVCYGVNQFKSQMENTTNPIDFNLAQVILTNVRSLHGHIS